jgi:trimethylamine--corrinoid protein Co-methyltransferase
MPTIFRSSQTLRVGSDEEHPLERRRIVSTGFFSALTQVQIEDIHDSALRVLKETGVLIESEELLALVGESGGEPDLQAQRIRFSPTWVEQFIADADKYDWTSHQPSFHCSAGIYQGLCLDPETDELKPFTEETLRDYIRVGHGLAEIGSVGLLGLPFVPEWMPAAYTPLAEKLYAWKHRAHPDGTVQFTGLCPYLEEMYARYAEETGRSLSDVFGATGYLLTPLRLARSECEQLLHFRSRGLRMGIGHMLSLGISTPVTIAGAAVLKLAESLFLSILRHALWGDRGFSVGGFGVVGDMRSARSMGGRPEGSTIGIVLGQVARWYGVRSGGGGGLSDAKEPSPQAGMQKALAAAIAVCTCGSAGLDAGLLSLDEINSPEQMVHDAELTGALQHLLRPVEVTEETLAVEDIAAAAHRPPLPPRSVAAGRLGLGGAARVAGVRLPFGPQPSEAAHPGDPIFSSARPRDKPGVRTRSSRHHRPRGRGGGREPAGMSSTSGKQGSLSVPRARAVPAGCSRVRRGVPAGPGTTKL